MATTKTTTKKTTTTSAVTTTTLAKELANLTEQVTALRVEVADLQTSTPQAAPTTTAATTTTVDAEAREMIGKVLALLRNSSLVRDWELTDAGLK